MADKTIHLGIDLGTTNCVAAYVDASGQPRSVVNFEGDVLTPSAVLFDGDTVLVGREAIKASLTRPQDFVECFKREMGDDWLERRMNGEALRPEFLSAVMLRRLKSDFERALGVARRAAITVPAYFDESRRRATQNAAAIAGWETTDIINEPTAAALVAAHRQERLDVRQKSVERLLVYDLGGGTFDTTILEVTPRREYRTLATDGDVRLGGCDWDTRLCRHLAEEFSKRTGFDPLQSPAGPATFVRLARQMKHSLSSRAKAESPVNFEGRRTVLSVNSETFKSLTADLLDRTRVTTQMVLEVARLAWIDIDRVLLVGGSSRMPMVAEMLARESGKPLDQSVSVDEAVAHGAAIYAHLLQTKSPVRVINVNAHSLRIIGSREDRPTAEEMIPRNSALPASSRTRLFPVRHPGQRSVKVKVCEGETDDPAFCEMIGSIVVRDLPEATNKLWKVAVKLKYRLDGTVAAVASVRDPDDLHRVIKEVSATIECIRGLDPGQIVTQRKRLESFTIG